MAMPSRGRSAVRAMDQPIRPAPPAQRRDNVACNFVAAPSLSTMAKLFLILILVGIALLIGLAAFLVVV